MIDTCAAFGVAAARRDGHPGCWIDPDGAAPRKIGALGIRIERGTSYHGIALNVDVDLRRLRAHRPVRHARPRLHVDRRARRAAPTSAPSTDAGRRGRRRLRPRVRGAASGRRSTGALPPDADPAAERARPGAPRRAGGGVTRREARP